MAANTEFTATIRISYTDGSSNAVSGVVTSTADGITNRIIPLAAGVTDLEVDIDFVYTRLKEFFALATQNCTIETNATDHTGGDLITLKADSPYWWSSTGGVANPFSAAVTKCYITNQNASVAGQIQINCLYDSTP